MRGLTGWLCFWAAALPPALLSAQVTVPAAIGGQLADPDSTMRLVRIEQGLAAGWMGHAVARDGSGAGTVLHWSHLLDSLLVAAAAPLAPVLGWHGALLVVATLAGPVSAGLLGVGIAWAVAPGVAQRSLAYAGFAVGMSAAALTYGRLGVAHHHLVLLAAVALSGGWMARAIAGRADAAARGGVAAAAALWLTPETMPLVLLVFGWPVVLWLARPQPRLAQVAVRFGLGLAGVLALAWAVDAPSPPLAPDIDRLSVVYVAFGVALTVSGLLLLRLPRGWAIALGPVPTLLWVAAFPAVLRGPDGLSAGASLMFSDIAEMLPVDGWGQAGFTLLAGALATLFAAARAVRARSVSWGYAAAAGLAACALGAWHVRFGAYPACFAAAVLPFAASAARAIARPGLRVSARLGAAVSVVVLPLLVAASAPAAPEGRMCAVGDAAALLAPFGGEVVLSSPNDVPALLYRTGVRTVGSLYHRNVAGYLRLRAAWRSGPSARVPEAVRETGATLVLACPGAPRLRFVADLPPETLWDRLSAGTVPDWLEEVGRAPGGGPVLYRVRGA